MPYIAQSRRIVLDAKPNLSETPGELNYVITKLVIDWLGDKPRYTTFNTAIGVLDCVKLELYRRTVAHYEDHKMADNGDVYPTCERLNGILDL
jgi:hypothetical protein